MTVKKFNVRTLSETREQVTDVSNKSPHQNQMPRFHDCQISSKCQSLVLLFLWENTTLTLSVLYLSF